MSKQEMEENENNTPNIENQEASNAEKIENESVETEVVEEKAEELTELEQLKLSLEESRDKYLRLNADFDNFRKRTAKERMELYKTAGEGVITDMLPVMDDFERGLDAMKNATDIKTLKKGVELVYDKFSKVLMNKGLTPLNAQGKVFDPEFHEAVTKIPAPSKKLKGKVVDEIEKGYQLGEKIIRYSKVVVGE